MSKVAVSNKPVSPTITLKKILQNLRARIRALFEPEEVEVTFLEEGKTSSYTYRVIEHKRAA
jgi:hypothetical protein